MITRLYLQQTVLEAARERVRFVLREFGRNTYVATSGGKDSTVVLNLALEAAEEMDLLPLRVLFVDQEAEWQSVIDYIRTVMHDPRVQPFWLQVPIFMTNATSMYAQWAHCWDPAAEDRWMRTKEPDSIHRNVYGVTRFADLFPAFMKYHHRRQPTARLTGMRAEESPIRSITMTQRNVYKGVTWAGRQDPKMSDHLTFHPLYDWSYSDIWKYIHESGAPYADVYNRMYQIGVPTMEMRVSNVHHETSTKALYYLQEIEPQTWERLTLRLQGVNSIGQLRASYYAPHDLPAAFASWPEYRDYILEHLADPEGREHFKRNFALCEAQYVDSPESLKNALYQKEVNAILKGDWESNVLLRQFMVQHPSPKQQQGRAHNRGEWLKQAKTRTGAGL